MKTSLKILSQIDQRIQNVNGFENEFSFEDFLFVSDENQNALVVKEDQGEASVLLCLQEKIIKRIENKIVPWDFKPELLPDLSIAIEELSHFNTYCKRAAEDREISPLELEVQAEVDKFALALEWLDELNQEKLQDEIFEILFGQCQVGAWVSGSKADRYVDAHRIARNFCRTILQQQLDSHERREKFRDFFSASPADKLSPKF